MLFAVTDVSRWGRKPIIRIVLTCGLLLLGSVGIAQTAPSPDGAVIGRVLGQVFQGTAGAALPENLTVTLHILDAILIEQTFDTQADTSGHFLFEGVPIEPVNTYFVSTLYRERAYASALVQGNPQAPHLELPIVIYETTADPAVISIIGISTTIDESEAVPGMLRVTQFMRFHNESDRLYTGQRDLDDGRRATLDIDLPAGAVVAELMSENSFVVHEDRFVLTDTRPVLPGAEHSVYLVYLLPYENDAIVEYPVAYALDGPVRVLVGVDSLALSSEQLPSLGTETAGERLYRVYGGTLTLSPGGLIRYDLTGGIGEEAITDAAAGTDSNELTVFIIGVVMVVGIAVIGLVVFSRYGDDLAARRQREIETLQRQMAELDRQHEAGEINHDLYHRRRAEQILRMEELLEERPGDDRP